MTCEADIEAAVGGGGSDSDLLALQGLADVPASAAPAEASVAVDPTDDVVAVVVDRRQGFREATGAGAVALQGHRQADRLMRPLGVVDMAPAIEAPEWVPNFSDSRRWV